MKEMTDKTEKYLFRYLNEANERLAKDAGGVTKEVIKYRYEHSLRVANIYLQKKKVQIKR